MDFTGVIIPFPTNRPLTDQERAHQLHQKRRLHLRPRYQLSVIRMNSTYLESVDKWYCWKGAVTTIAVAVFLTIAVPLSSAVWFLLRRASGAVDSVMTTDAALANGLGVIAVILVAALVCILALRRESFVYTHYPLRFNRKNKMVYVWRRDGSVFAAPWDDLFFTLAYVAGEWEVRGHLLAADKSTIVESLALSCRGVLSARDVDPAITQFSDEDMVRSHWEFVRRYMEDGPEAVSGQVEFCMPLDGRRERPAGGMHRVFANFAGASWVMILVMAPVCLAVALFRIFAMRTSVIPRWPEEVEAECSVEEEDPYAIVGDADGNRVAVYPAAAEAAGVKYTGIAAAPV